jgi:ribonuclease-3
MKRSNRFDSVAFEEKVELLLISLEIPYVDLHSYPIAFFHRSVLNELSLPESNERVEYLGDAVLELITTEYLFKAFTTYQEGQLTDVRSALVRGRNLADVALRLGLQDIILLSRGETQAGGNQNPYILANTFEALLGAIYLDLGIEEARKFVHAHIISTLSGIMEDELHIDPKSNLQEIIQASHFVTPHYELIAETGADHDKIYTVGAYLKDILIGQGTGSSKKKAQSSAAENALERKKEWFGK